EPRGHRLIRRAGGARRAAHRLGFVEFDGVPCARQRRWAGGPELRRREDGPSVIYANCGPAPGANPGGVGRHWPTAVPPRKGGGAGVKPSVLRHARIASATVCPHVRPLAMAAALS